MMPPPQAPNPTPIAGEKSKVAGATLSSHSRPTQCESLNVSIHCDSPILLLGEHGQHLQRTCEYYSRQRDSLCPQAEVCSQHYPL